MARWFPHVEQLGDITTADFTRFRGVADVLSGGFPCQNISCLGKGEGIKGAKSSLWKHYWRAIAEILPGYAVIENSGRLNSAGLESILYDLAEIGYDGEWCTISAAQYGAEHVRERAYILAYPNSQRRRNLLHLIQAERSEMFAPVQKKEGADTTARSYPFERVRESYGESCLLRDYHGLTKKLDPVNRIGGLGNAMYWPIPYAIFRWIDFAEKCTEAEWLQVNYDALMSLETDNS